MISNPIRLEETDFTTVSRSNSNKRASKIDWTLEEDMAPLNVISTPVATSMTSLIVDIERQDNNETEEITITHECDL